MVLMDRQLEDHHIEGEIGLVIEYQAGKARALDVLSGAMALVQAIDELDKALLSSIDTELEPVSILNDVQHSSLKMLLARALRKMPDDHLGGLEWKKWVGGLLVKGKYSLLQKLDADAGEIERELVKLESDYKAAPSLIGYSPPKIKDVQNALQSVAKARDVFENHSVTVETEYGDVSLTRIAIAPVEVVDATVANTVVNKGREFLKVRYPDMLGNAQWTVMRAGRVTRVDVLHQSWLDAYHQREFSILPGDSLDCSFEERVGYDSQQNEVERKISIIEVFAVISPPVQTIIPI
jgi:hypothetical protein